VTTCGPNGGQAQTTENGPQQEPTQGGGSLSSALGATDVSGWKDFADCMAPTSVHHES
jgi:hypothetical protein